MRLYYNDGVYPVTWKTGMRKDRWYSMEPAKIKVTMPKSVYETILKDVNKINNNPKRDSVYLFKFELSKSESDIVEWGISEHKSGLWRMEAFIYSCSVSSKFKNGDVIVIFDIAVSEVSLMDNSILKARLRDQILNELV